MFLVMEFVEAQQKLAQRDICCGLTGLTSEFKCNMMAKSTVCAVVHRNPNQIKASTAHKQQAHLC